MSEIRKMGAKPFSIQVRERERQRERGGGEGGRLSATSLSDLPQVYRGNKWQKMSTEDLLPEDIVSIGKYVSM